MATFGDFEFVGFDPQAIAAKLEELGQQWAKHEAHYVACEHRLKNWLAEKTVELKGKGGSWEGAKQAALSDPDYMTNARVVAAAKREANEARASYDAIRAYVDMTRTKLSTERAAMNLR